jgi:hypothetical protein
MVTPLVPQRAALAFTGGQEQGTAKELLDPPLLVRAHNVEYLRSGELSKRRAWHIANEAVYGYPYLPIPDRVIGRYQEPLWIGGTLGQNYHDHYPPTLFSRAQGESDEDWTPTHWVAKGAVPRFSSRKLAEITHSLPGRRIDWWDCAVAGHLLTNATHRSDGVVLMVWRADADNDESNAAYAAVEYAAIDVRTKAVLAQATLVTNALSITPVRVLALYHPDQKWYFHVYCCLRDGDSTLYGNLYRVTIPASTPWEHRAPVLVASNLTNFDAIASRVDTALSTPNVAFIATSSPAFWSVITLQLLAPSAGGGLPLQTVVSMTLDAYPNCVPVYWALQVACSPDGTEVGLHVPVWAAGCVGGQRNVAVMFRAALTPSYSLTPFNDTIVALLDDATRDGMGGAQIGWAGIRTVGSVNPIDNFWLSWERPEPNTQGVLGTSITSAGADIVAHPLWVHTVTRRPWGRPFHYDGQCYVPTISGSTSDACVVEVIAPYVPDGGEGGDPVAAEYRIAARALAGEVAFASGTGRQEFPLCRGRNSVVESYYEPGRFFACFPVVSLDGTQHNLALIDFDAREPIRYQSDHLHGGTYIATSIPWCYDGGTGHEIGFPFRPQSTLGEPIVGAYAVDVGQVALEPGAYQVALTWEGIDSLGRVARSAPSISGVVTVTTDQFLRVTLLNLCVTTHQNVRLVVYVARTSDGIFVRSEETFENVWYATSERTISLDSDKLFQPGMPTLYTSSGILPSGTPPAARFACAWQGRIILANDRWIYPSKELVDGEEASFPGELFFQAHHDITGIIGFDDRLLIFHLDSIYWISGDGPTDTGEGGSFIVPQRVPTDFGCIDARSIVRIDRGIVYQSSRGLELIGPDLVPAVMSGGIDKLMKVDMYSEVMSTCWDAKNSVLKLVLRSINGYTLIASYFSRFDAWTTSDVPTLAASSRANRVADIINDGERNWLAKHDDALGAFRLAPMSLLAIERERSDGYESYIYLDGSTSFYSDYRLHVETADLKLESLAGFVRVWRLYLTVKDMHQFSTGFSLGYAIDYADDPVQTREWVTAEDVAACVTDSPDHYQFGVHVAHQQCSAIRCIIEDRQAPATADPASVGFTLVSLGFEWGQKVGTGRGHPASRK